MLPKRIQKQLDETWQSSPVHTLGPGEKIVIFSDLHMGAGGRNDDFSRNGDFFKRLLDAHYLEKNWTLVLNGDVEELLRHPMKGIVRRWDGLYETYRKFFDKGQFWKIEGNHDPAELQNDQGYPVLGGLRIILPGGELFVCHGHQGGLVNSGRFNVVLAGLLRVFANTFGIKNFSPAYHLATRYKLEDRLYHYASGKGLAMAVGHTHRPLFETRSKTSAYEDQLDHLCKKWVMTPVTGRSSIEKRIAFMRTNYLEHIRSAAKDLPTGIYNKEILLPSLFNSGCCIGKRGITGLEITAKKMRLVHWSDPAIHPPSKVHLAYLSIREVLPGLLKTVIRKESTAKIMAKIKLLAEPLA